MKSPDKNAVYVKNAKGRTAIAERYDPSKMVLKPLSKDLVVNKASIISELQLRLER